MNLIDVAAALKGATEADPPELLGILLMNRHCYIHTPFDEEPLVKRTVELKQEMLEQLFQG